MDCLAHKYEYNVSRRNQEILEKEIDLIQACIDRMSQKSFLVKGWMISLITILASLSGDNENTLSVLILGGGAVLVFWYLNAYYLKLSRLYRWKYEWILVYRNSCDAYLYDLNPYNKGMWLSARHKEESILKVMCSETLLPIYLGSIIALFVYYSLN